jgi:Leucine-rich repeat (LRR) protein
VTELHLQKNELTAQSLARLGEVIALSAGDLRELDLSQNDIRVKTPEEQMMWRDFLLSFKNCYMLKKLDLGSNPLGPAGVEILARVYIKSDLDFLETDADAIIGPHVDETTDIVEQLTALKIRPEKDKENDAPKHRAKKLLGKAKAPRQNGLSSCCIFLITSQS